MSSVEHISEIDSESGFTEKEMDCHDSLMKMMDQFIKLPREHPTELHELQVAVHIIQGLLSTRIVRRHYPEYWPVKT